MDTRKEPSVWFVFVAKITSRTTYFAKTNSAGERNDDYLLLNKKIVFDSFLLAKVITTSIDSKKMN